MHGGTDHSWLLIREIERSKRRFAGRRSRIGQGRRLRSRAAGKSRKKCQDPKGRLGEIFHDSGNSEGRTLYSTMVICEASTSKGLNSPVRPCGSLAVTI